MDLKKKKKSRLVPSGQRNTSSLGSVRLKMRHVHSEIEFVYTLHPFPPAPSPPSPASELFLCVLARSFPSRDIPSSRSSPDSERAAHPKWYRVFFFLSFLKLRLAQRESRALNQRERPQHSTIHASHIPSSSQTAPPPHLPQPTPLFTHTHRVTLTQTLAPSFSVFLLQGVGKRRKFQKHSRNHSQGRKK